MKITKEIKAVFIVLLGTIVLVLGIIFLKSGSFFNLSDHYYAVYTDVGGLTKSSPVMLNGYKVGSVKSIDFMGDGQLIISFTLDYGDYRLSKNSKANLSDSGIIGGRVIEIIPEIDSGQSLKTGDTLQTIFSEGLREVIGNKIDPIALKMSYAIQSIDSTFSRLNNILRGKRLLQIDDIIISLRKTAKALNNSMMIFNKLLVENENNMNQTIKNIHLTTKNIKDVSILLKDSKLDEGIANLNQILKRMKTITEKLDKGEGSLGKMINDDALYHNLNQSFHEMEELLRDMKLHPKRYFSILRRKETPYNPEK